MTALRFQTKGWGGTHPQLPFRGNKAVISRLVGCFEEWKYKWVLQNVWFSRLPKAMCVGVWWLFLFLLLLLEKVLLNATSGQIIRVSSFLLWKASYILLELFLLFSPPIADQAEEKTAEERKQTSRHSRRWPRQGQLSPLAVTVDLASDHYFVSDSYLFCYASMFQSSGFVWKTKTGRNHTNYHYQQSSTCFLSS